MNGVRVPVSGTTGRDVGLAGFAVLVPLFMVLTDQRGLGPDRQLLWAVLVVLTCAVLVVRRRYPLVVAAVCASASLAADVVGGRDVSFFVVVLALGSAAFHAARHWSAIAVGAMVWATAFALLGGGPADPLSVGSYAGLGAAPVAVGVALRFNLDRAVDRALLRQARGQAEAWSQLARDVHDAVGHQLSAIHLQAQGGRRALARGTDGAGPALDAVAELSQQALDEIRDLLDRIRDGAPGAPDLSDLPALAARLGSAELRIDLAVDAGELPRAVGSCAYRVAQESLTNVVRHSAADRVDVRVRRSGGVLVVTVDDPGPARPQAGGAVRPGDGVEPSAGGEHAGAGGVTAQPARTAPGPRGVDGMRERVHALGGSFRAGPHGAGWRVRAELPLAEVVSS